MTIIPENNISEDDETSEDNDTCDICGDDVSYYHPTYLCNRCDQAICQECRTSCDTCGDIVCNNNICCIKCPIKINDISCNYICCFNCNLICPICTYFGLCSDHSIGTSCGYCGSPCSICGTVNIPKEINNGNLCCITCLNNENEELINSSSDEE